jgi:hypothetical protein
VGAPFRRFLDGPVRDFFLGQATVERGGDWTDLAKDANVAIDPHI